MSKWTLFSNHGHVLFCLVKDSGSRLRDVAADVGITERAVQKIVRDLQDVGILSVTKDGRRNRYRIDKSQSLRHELEAHRSIADLVRFIADTPPKASAVSRGVMPKVDSSPAHMTLPDEPEIPEPVVPEPVVPKPVTPEPIVPEPVVPKPVVPELVGEQIPEQATATAEKVTSRSTEEKLTKEKRAKEKQIKSKSEPESLVERQQGSLF